MTTVIGIDIGGTKTQLALADAEDIDADIDAGTTLREETVPSSSWRAGLGDVEADARAVHDLILDRFGDDARTAAVAVGAHGCENTAQCAAFQRALAIRWEGPVLVVNDSELIAPAMGAGAAIGVVVGTGSIATARDADGGLVTAGGWGWLLGDEGSAPGLVREATRAVLDDVDRGNPFDPLGVRLLAAFDAGDAAELALAVTESSAAEVWGRSAPEVFAAADEGSELAAAVIADAGDRLAGLVVRLIERGIRADTVVAGGSVVQRQPRLQDAFRTSLAERADGLPLAILDRTPVHGALALARGLLAAGRPPIQIGVIPQ
ncbi:N-acetylglucosamine kinase [Leifsonia sp. NPDC058194]|uniref:N-acetylglucosamine kinase n=1 Tax=Leifsonia sp. NPDC058194 TaxID=3346374 RepID=UPI0036D89A4A